MKQDIMDNNILFWLSVGIVLFLVFRKYFIKRELEKMRTREGLSVKDIGNAFKNIGKKMKTGFEDAGQKIKAGFEDMANKMMDGFNKILKPIIDIFKEITHQFEVLPKRFNGLRDGFDKSFKGIESGIVNFGVALGNSSYDTLMVPARAGWMTIEYIICGFKIIGNLPLCILCYVFDLVVSLLEYFFRSILYAMELVTGVNFNKQIDELFKSLHFDKLDDTIYEMTSFGGKPGIHLFRYPDYIQSRCYSCQPEVTPSKIMKDVEKVNYDFTEMWPRMMNEPQHYFRESRDRFYDFVNPRL